MGTGKTSWAIQRMNQNTGKSFCYITPYLDEVQRIKDNTTIDIYDPKHNGTGKLENLNDLLASGENVVSTHSLFSRITDETRNLIRQGHYTLILDGALNPLDTYDISSDDIKLLFENELVTLDENNQLIWNEAKNYPDSRYADIQTLAKQKSLIYLNDSVLLWNIPISNFAAFDHIYILTYMFDGQIMKPYFDFHNVNCEYKSITIFNGKYILAPYNPSANNGAIYKELIHILQDKKLNAIGDKCTALSKSWYNTCCKKGLDSLHTLKNNITNYFKNKIYAKSSTIAWSTYVDYQDILSANGRIYTRRLSSLKRNASPESIHHLQCFIPCSSSALPNIYPERFNLAYTLNIYVNPFIITYLSTRNIVVDQDRYALYMMLQWIWKSRIRNMEPINIYIPSSRMRHLLESWIA